MQQLVETWQRWQRPGQAGATSVKAVEGLFLFVIRYCFVLLTFAALSGCSAKREPQLDVSGTVLHQGKTVQEGTVMLQPRIGKAIVVAVDKQGRYRLSAPAGTYKVAVVSSAGIPDDIDPWKKNAKLPVPLVPEKFGRPETSETSITISPENTTINIALR